MYTHIYIIKSVRRQHAILFLKMDRRLEQTFTKDIQMVNEHMKSFLTLIVIREVQIKTTEYNFTPIRMAKIKRSYNTKYW